MNKLNFKCYDSPFATRLRLLMTENGTKQNIIAELLGVTRQSVSQYCDGTSVPPVDKIIILANYYNVSTDYILGVSDNNAPNDNEALKTACGYTGLSGNAVNVLSKYTKKPFTRIFLEYLIKEKKILNLLTRYFVSTTIQNYINITDYKLIPLKNSDDEMRIIFADIIEHLPIARNEFDIELNGDTAIIKDLCFEYLLWAMDRNECKFYAKEFVGLTDYNCELSENELAEIDEWQREKYENKTADEFWQEQLELQKEIEEFKKYEQEGFEQDLNIYSMINELFKYEKQKEGEINGNNSEEGQQL